MILIDDRLAKYFRCMNERCRAEMPLQLVEGSGRVGKVCDNCRGVMVELSLWNVSETYRIGEGWCEEWKGNVKVMLGERGIGKGEYWILGYPRVDLKTASYYIEAIGIKEAISMNRMEMLVRCNSSHVGLAKLWSPIRTVRMLELVRLLMTDAKVLIRSFDEPLGWRECMRLYNGDVLRGDQIDHRLLKALLADPKNTPAILLIGHSSQVLCRVEKLLSYYDCLLDWTIGDVELDKISSGMILNPKSQKILIPAGSNEKFIWNEDVKAALQEYFVGFRDLACSHNDGCRFPLHQPTRQFALLRGAVERATLLRGCERVERQDVAMAAMLGEILLEQRYGVAVFTMEMGDGHRASCRSNPLLSPCPSVDYRLTDPSPCPDVNYRLTSSLPQAINQLRAAFNL